jgi:hypothetical protein
MGQIDDDLARYGWPEDDEDTEESEVRCKFCRTRDLHWEEARGERNQKKWVLMEENGTMHACPPGEGFSAGQATDEEFPPV